MRFVVGTGTKADCGAIGELMRESVLGLQPESTERQREAALRTVFTPDSQLIDDQTYFVAEAEGMLAGAEAGASAERCTLAIIMWSRVMTVRSIPRSMLQG